jgi:Asp-tRNA(Asn)/Glu-tRNA(Gln) amidotransferase A subunit family amidase
MSSTEKAPLSGLGVRETAVRVRAGQVTAGAVVEAALAAVQRLEPTLAAWAHLDAEGARAAARALDAARPATGGALRGVPVGIKDIFHVAGMPTTAGSRPFAHSRPAVDATSVARLRAAGAIVLGKTHTTEFAFRDPGPTTNPWNPRHTPGGSSSGSAAAVAARMVPAALGTQTVGSVLRPAAYCGVVGFKPTHGLVPADGVIPLAWSLDHVGVFARTVDDVALVLGVLTGRGLDPVPVGAPRLALAPELLERATPEVAAHVRMLAERFAAAGAKVAEVRLPAEFGGLAAAGQRVLEAEAAAYHREAFATHEKDYGRGIAEMIRVGLSHSAVDYVVANRARLAFREAVMPLLAAHDALLSPTAPGTAPEGLAYTGDASLCAPWSSAGVPSVSLPSGVSAASGLPLAVQLVQTAGAEARLLGVAAWCERVLGPMPAPPGT